MSFHSLQFWNQQVVVKAPSGRLFVYRMVVCIQSYDGNCSETVISTVLFWIPESLTCGFTKQTPLKSHSSKAVWLERVFRFDCLELTTWEILNHKSNPSSEVKQGSGASIVIELMGPTKVSWKTTAIPNEVSAGSTFCSIHYHRLVWLEFIECVLSKHKMFWQSMKPASQGITTPENHQVCLLAPNHEAELTKVSGNTKLLWHGKGMCKLKVHRQYVLWQISLGINSAVQLDDPCCCNTMLEIQSKIRHKRTYGSYS